MVFSSHKNMSHSIVLKPEIQPSFAIFTTNFQGFFPLQIAPGVVCSFQNRLRNLWSYDTPTHNNHSLKQINKNKTVLKLEKPPTLTQKGRHINGFPSSVALEVATQITCDAASGKFSNITIHYIDVIMTTMAPQITSPTVVYSTVYSDADQRKHQSSASLASVWGIHRDRWIRRTKGQLRGKCFHLMTSSCFLINVSGCPARVGHDDTEGPLLLTWLYLNPSMDK